MKLTMQKKWNLRYAINRPNIQHCMILRRTCTKEKESYPHHHIKGYSRPRIHPSGYILLWRPLLCSNRTKQPSSGDRHQGYDRQRWNWLTGNVSVGNKVLHIGGQLRKLVIQTYKLCWLWLHSLLTKLNRLDIFRNSVTMISNPKCEE